MSSRWMAVLQERQKNIDKSNATCQKCLEKGHWTYECKNSRKYLQRESRTKQMLKNIKENRKRTLGQGKLNGKRRKKSTSTSSSSSSSGSSTEDSSESENESDKEESQSSSSSSSSDSSSSSSSSDSSDSDS